MNTSQSHTPDWNPGNWLRRLLLLLLLIPLLLLVLTPMGRSWGMTPVALLVLAILNFLLLAWLFRRTAHARVPALPKPRMILPHEQPSVIQEVMDVCIATQEDGMQLFRGPLRESPDSAYERLKQACGPGTIALLQQDQRLETSIILMDRPVESALVQVRTRPALHWGLFFLTLLTTTWAGATYQGVNLLQHPERFAVGIPYSLGLLAILGCHELGHYFAARLHQMNVTPPFFIPVPFALGTFGAFIRMRTPPEERTSLFDMAIAGPLGGLVIALPALIVGLFSSRPVGPSFGEERFLFSGLAENSLLLGLITRLDLSPLAFAGWLGLLVTLLNMVPIGQLDGGHIMRAMFGTRTGTTISSVAMWSLLLLAIFVLPWLLLWVVIIFFMARNVTPPLNDLTEVQRWRKVLGTIAFAVVGMLLVPLPDGFWNALFKFYPNL